MAESGVIQEMLINIGFKTDEAGQRRYQDSIAGITKGAALLVTSLTGAAIAAQVAIDKISTDLSALADAWVKRYFPTGKPLGEGRQSSLQIHDSRSVKHETNISVIGSDAAPTTSERPIDTADLLGHLQGNSA